MYLCVRLCFEVLRRSGQRGRPEDLSIKDQEVERKRKEGGKKIKKMFFPLARALLPSKIKKHVRESVGDCDRSWIVKVPASSRGRRHRARRNEAWVVLESERKEEKDKKKIRGC